MTPIPDIGSVEITVTPSGGAPGRVRVKSTRRTRVTAMLVGQPADERLPRMISLLYTLCPQAQASAWKAAVALAQRRELAPEIIEPWAAAVQLEAMTEHMRCFVLELPKALGMEDTVSARPVGALRAKISRAASLDEAGRRALLAEASAAARDLLFGHSGPLPSLSERKSTAEIEAWVSTLRNVLRPVLSYLVMLPRELGVATARRLDTASPTVRKELTTELARPGFCFEPHLFTGPAQTSALSRRVASPALMPELLRRRPGCFDYFYARLLELGTWCRGFEAPSALISGFSPEPGVGISFVETARGVLTHRVRLERGIVREASIVAPTEWNFYPGGAAEEALNSLGVTDWASWRSRAEIVVRQFDACIPYKMTTEASRA